MRKLHVLSILLATSCLTFAAPAMAGTVTVTSEAWSQYILQDFDVRTSKTPVFQPEVDWNSGGRSTFGLWMSTGFTSQGVWGHRGGKEEIDGYYWWDDTTKLPVLGEISYELSAQYFDLGLAGPHNGLGTTHDDVLELYGKASRSFAIGDATVSPYLQLTQYVGFGVVQDSTHLRLGAACVVPLGGMWSIGCDASWSHDFSAGYDGNHPDLVRGWAGVSYGKTVVVTPLEVKFSDHNVAFGMKLVFKQ